MYYQVSYLWQEQIGNAKYNEYLLLLKLESILSSSENFNHKSSKSYKNIEHNHTNAAASPFII